MKFSPEKTELAAFPVFDAQEVLENIGFELEIYKEMVGIYLSACSGQGLELAAKLAGSDIKSMLECAHSLKGTMANIGGKRLAEIARQIQDICLEGKKPDCVLWGPIVEAETAAVNTALEHIDWDRLARSVADK